MKTVIIIPTYNEKDNIGRLIEAIQLLKVPSSYSLHILVVDDNSPDGTAEIVRGYRRQYDNIHLIQGEKAGLGLAYIRGMRYALDHLDAQAVMEMDADLSHDPQDVPRLIEELSNGANFVIGSRYIPGGSIPAEWNWVRKGMSRYGNFFVRHLIGMTQVRDCTAGFRLINAALLRQIPLEELNVQGYAFQVALLHEAVLLKADIREVPVQFTERTSGVSKLGLSDVFEFIFSIVRFQFGNHRAFRKLGYQAGRD